ncbi:outer membrane protein assembly factor BamB family protein [Deefgea rivuli]|uniref:outer membrane protein assembly factor BamB family protein n=1 Tax=Deefgea rivuli TaxID=400948 RepID=UPI00146FC1F5|nr:PQQ-binding-like beta-propeller repeat protein [Deefgea rivuli]
MSIQSDALSRMIAQGTSINIQLTALASNFTPTSTLYASASDTMGVLQKPVTVVDNGAGSYTFSLDTLSTAPSGHYAGTLKIKLCSDQDCKVPQAVSSISIPYDLTIIGSNSAWLGNKITPLAAMNGAANWSTFQGNNAHTGYVPVEVKPDQMQPRWKRGAVSANGTGYSSAMSSLVTSNGLFYASMNKQLTAFKELDGSAVWSYDVSGLEYPSVNPPAVANGVVYMAAGQQSSTFLFALDGTNGSLRFKAPMSAQWEDYLAPVVTDSGVYTNAGTFGGMYAFSLSGEQLFFGSLDMTDMWSPAADNKHIYAYTGEALTMFDPKTGVKQGTIVDSNFTNYVYQLSGAAVIGANGGVYAAAYENAYLSGGGIGNDLVRFDTTKGILDWRINGVYTKTPAYADGVLYIPNSKPYRIEARAEKDGALLWQWIPPYSGDTAYFSSPIVTKNLLFVSSNLNTYAVDLRSHKVVWSYPMPGNLALSQNGILYIQGADTLVAINLK